MSHLRLDPSRPHPDFGPLCATCGTAADAADHWELCRPFSERPALWNDGWVDLHAFGLPAALAEGWPEVQQRTIAITVDGGFGPEMIQARSGPWVRHPDTSAPSHRRVAALAVLLTAGESAEEAVAKVLDADAATLDE